MSIFRLLHCALPVAAVVSLGAPETFAQGDTGSIQGRVFLEGTREPVAGVVVRAVPPRIPARWERP